MILIIIQPRGTILAYVFTHLMKDPIAYTFSPLLHTLTSAIDHYRTHILTVPLLPRKEMALRTIATEHRILEALTYARIPMTAAELSRLLHTPPKRPHPMEREALMYRQALAYIRDEWTGLTRSPTLADIEVLMHISYTIPFPRISRILHNASEDLSAYIAYAHTSQDHPVILAGITHAYLSKTLLHEASRGRITSLMTDVIMAASGYDIRAMLAVEPQLLADRKAYDHALSSTSSYGQMTIWLEYFAACVCEAYKALEKQVMTAHASPEKRSPVSLLSERQKQILILLNSYGAKTTNRDVQRRFHISQITASRDLSKLVSDGYLSRRGKGRSISYTLS